MAAESRCKETTMIHGIRKRAPIVQIRKMCQAAIDRADSLIESSEGDRNPQIIEMANRAKGRKEAFEAVSLATKCEYFLLNSFSRGG